MIYTHTHTGMHMHVRIHRHTHYMCWGVGAGLLFHTQIC
uniref:Uncharacterized protein n=1 Tax=Anguilla anguilla TaxID=7936 RepID=A0A0E9P8L6_ANGAN